MENYHKIRSELELYSEVLMEKLEIVVLNKADLDPEGIFCDDIRSRLPESIKDVLVISAVSGQGLDELNERLWAIIKGKDDEPDSY